MLVLTRRLNEEIICEIAHPDGTRDTLRIVVLNSNQSRAKLGIQAPLSVTVSRGGTISFDKEVYESTNKKR